MELLEERRELDELGNEVFERLVLCLGAGARDYMLFPRSSRDGSTVEDDGVAACEARAIRWTCPINITVNSKLEF